VSNAPEILIVIVTQGMPAVVDVKPATTNRAASVAETTETASDVPPRVPGQMTHNEVGSSEALPGVSVVRRTGSSTEHRTVQPDANVPVKGTRAPGAVSAPTSRDPRGSTSVGSGGGTRAGRAAADARRVLRDSEPPPDSEETPHEHPALRVQKPAAQANMGRSLRITGIAAAATGLLAIGVGVKQGLDARSASQEISRNEGQWTAEHRRRYAEGGRAQRNMFGRSVWGSAALVTGSVLYAIGYAQGGQSSAAERLSLSGRLEADQVALMFSGCF
jgi:hypothetical protein